MGVIIFNGTSSKDLELRVAKAPDYVAAKRDFQSIDIPGRNGSVHIDNGRFQNVSRSYEVSFAIPGYNDHIKLFTLPASKIAAWLNAPIGYARLEDSYDAGVYRMARYNGDLNIENILSMAGKATLEFDCMPERFLKTGEEPIEGVSYVEVVNPTLFPAKPRIEIVGTGRCNLYVESQMVILDLGNQTSITVDCYYKEVYSGNIDMNNNCTLVDGDFPTIAPGKCRIGVDGSGITKLKVTPNWWTI